MRRSQPKPFLLVPQAQGTQREAYLFGRLVRVATKEQEEPMVEKLVSGWIEHFWSADHNIQWHHVERTLHLWLDEVTLLVGQCDASGLNGEGRVFFGEWKTANSREASTWKQIWRKNPQSLTYGVLYQTIYPGLEDFTVRKAFKPNSFRGKTSEPSYDHAWYRYSPDELRQWRFQVMQMASEIREYRAEGRVPWPTNYRTCFEYGAKYPCPFFEGCDTQQWDLVPDGTHPPLPYGAKCVPPEARPWLVGILSERPASKELVVLSATSIEMWLRCRERFRKIYEVGIDLSSSQAQLDGSEFHHALSRYYSTLVTKEK